MSKLHNLKALMTINAKMDTVQIEERFEQIAKTLFGDFSIQKDGRKYSFKEIEFYFYNDRHRDVITHPRCSDALCWYVNDFGGIDLNFESWVGRGQSSKDGKYRCALDDNSCFGGVLLRQIVSEDGTEVYDGPWSCAELFRCFDASGQGFGVPTLVEHDSGMVGYVRKERLRLLTGSQKVEAKVDNILCAYDSHPDRDGLYEAFSYFKGKLYRFVRCETLMHDRATNVVYFSDWLGHNRHGYPEFYLRLVSLLDEMDIEHDVLPGTNDYWARDYMPIQLRPGEFVRYNYNPDYLVAEGEYITDSAKVLRKLGIKARHMDIVIDGGNMVACGPYIVITDKVFAENGKEKDDAEFKLLLERELGCPVIIIPWVYHEPEEGQPKDEVDVYGHSDGFIKWCGNNRILMGNHGDMYPDEARDIREVLEGCGFEVTEMRFNGEVDEPNYEYNWSYINFLQVGDKIVMPKFDIQEDAVALRFVKESFPGCEVRQIEMREVVKSGGALHCLSWNILK